MELFFIDDDAFDSERAFVAGDPAVQARVDEAKALLRAAGRQETPHHRVFRAGGVTVYGLEIKGGGVLLWRPFPDPALATAAAVIYVGVDLT